jgi:uncharacterized protein YktB (UPF0637 family)
LANEAQIGLFEDKSFGWSVIAGTDRHLEKFAELIVRECVAICQDIDGEDNIDARSGRQDCAVEIKQHFGVEE